MMISKKSQRKPDTVRSRMIRHSALILLIMMSATLYTGLASFQLADSVSVLFRNNLLMKDLRESLARTETSLTNYLTSKNSDALKEYIKNSTHLSDTARKLNQEIRNDESLLLQRDLAHSIEQYIIKTETSVSGKRGRDVQTYSTAYYESEKIADVIRFLIEKNEKVFIADSIAAFSNYKSVISPAVTTNAILVVAATLLGLMLLISYSYTLTEPLAVLAEAANALGTGNYEAELPKPNRMDEISVMATAFSTMRDNIKQSFNSMQEKAEMEKSLMQERMHVLDMEHKLKDAELLALQSQINPHFLYNTLSAGMGIAWEENADRTSNFLEDLAGFIRYALKPTFRTVLVSEELECAQRYIRLLQARFGARYQFEIHAEESALSAKTPALLLQPLIENAITHGLAKKEEGGTIKVSITTKGSDVVLQVEDDGEGMSEHEIARLYQELDTYNEPARKDGSGIGLRNVMRRITLSTNGVGVVEIHSILGSGTTVTIRVPRKGD